MTSRGAKEPSHGIPIELVRRNAALVAVGPVLLFLWGDLAVLVSRLGSLADELSTRDILNERLRAESVKLGAKLRDLGRLLHRQSPEDWRTAAKILKGKHGVTGWSQTCWNIARNPESQDNAALVGDRLEEAGQHLAQLCDESNRATAAQAMRAAGAALLRAASIWNTLPWRKPMDRALRDHSDT